MHGDIDRYPSAVSHSHQRSRLRQRSPDHRGRQRSPIAGGSFVVQNGRLIAVGRKGAVKVSAGAAHVDLTGKTVMPALVNVHVHIGYEGYTNWRAENYTPQNILDHLERETYYGVCATMSVGGHPPDQAKRTASS
jgi:imidazolonepropionase-like amidohydrolase